MRKNFGTKPFTYPQPVYILAAYDEDGTPNAMNAAWAGISNDTEISFCLGSDRKTLANLRKRGAFTVSMGTVSQVEACDYVGIVSGNKVPNKFELAGFHATKAEFVDAPLIDELPMAVECKFVSFDENTGCLIGEIINVNADESILGEDGKIDPQLLQALIFDPIHNDYLVVGKKVGNAFQDGLKIKRGK